MTAPAEFGAWSDADHLLAEPADDGNSAFDTDTDSDAAAAAPSGLYYPDVDAFVRGFLAPTYRRHVDGRRRTWCPQWWRHAEALIRLEALWRSWEHLRQDPATGMSVWLRDHADHHLPVLLDPDGPFKYCNPEQGHSPRLAALPTVPADGSGPAPAGHASPP